MKELLTLKFWKYVFTSKTIEARTVVPGEIYKDLKKLAKSKNVSEKELFDGLLDDALLMFIKQENEKTGGNNS